MKQVILLIALLGFVAAGPAPAQSVDVDAAQALAKKNDCFKCHAIEKTKKAPPYKRIAGRLKSKPDAVGVVIEHITTGPTIELEDGSVERHRIIDTKDPAELGNLARWILSL